LCVSEAACAEFIGAVFLFVVAVTFIPLLVEKGCLDLQASLDGVFKCRFPIGRCRWLVILRERAESLNAVFLFVVACHSAWSEAEAQNPWVLFSTL
jgi:hypothetical protein